MDWHYERITSFRYMKVDRQTRKDIEELFCFEDGGTIEYSDLTAIKVSGSLPYIRLPEIGNDYIRVYSQRRLSELSSSVESIEVTHPWLSYEMGAGIQLVYTEAAYEMTGIAVKRVLRLSPAMLCTVSIRRFVRR